MPLSFPKKAQQQEYSLELAFEALRAYRNKSNLAHKISWSTWIYSIHLDTSWEIAVLMLFRAAGSSSCFQHSSSIMYAENFIIVSVNLSMNLKGGANWKYSIQTLHLQSHWNCRHGPFNEPTIQEESFHKSKTSTPAWRHRKERNVPLSARRTGYQFWVVTALPPWTRTRITRESTESETHKLSQSLTTT